LSLTITYVSGASTVPIGMYEHSIDFIEVKKSARKSPSGSSGETRNIAFKFTRYHESAVQLKWSNCLWVWFDWGNCTCVRRSDLHCRASFTQARRQDLATGGSKNQKKGPKTRRGAIFLKYCIGCMQQPGAKREMGGHRIQMRGRGRHHWAPRWRRLCLYNFQSSYEWYRRTVLCSPHHHAISLTYARI